MQKKKFQFEIPKIESKGVALYLVSGEQMIHCSISPINMGKSLACTLQRNGKLVDYQLISSKENTKISFLCDTLKAGVHQFTVFDVDGRIWAERLFFVYPRQNLNHFELSFSGQFFPYGKENFNLKLIDCKGNNVSNATFSMSVRDGDRPDCFYNAGNIGTYLLLSSEVRGFIEEPGYYFDSRNENRIRDMDILMMVQGWRRYDWELMAGVRPFVLYYQHEDRMKIQGSVYKRTSPRKWRKEVFVRCQIHYPNYIYEGIQQTKNGKFNFDVIQIYGNYPMFLQVYRKESHIKKNFDYTEWDNSVYSYRSKCAYICKERVLPPLPKQFAFYEIHEKEWDLTKDSILQGLINEVEVQEKQNVGLDLKHPNFTYDVTEVCDFLNDIGCIKETILSYSDLAYYVDAFCAFNRSHDDLHILKERNLNEYNTYNSLLMAGCSQGQLLVDDPYYRNRELSLRFSNLKSISYYSDYSDRKRFWDYLEDYPVTGSAYVSYELCHKKRLPVLIGDKCVFYGYTPSVQFYSPDYSNMELPDSDYRRTLYWNPMIKTDKEGCASMHFYNNKTCKKYIFSIEGITLDGIPFYCHKVYENK